MKKTAAKKSPKTKLIERLLKWAKLGGTCCGRCHH
jgi:hypothetical protein